jgi:hypothetical protein
MASFAAVLNLAFVRGRQCRILKTQTYSPAKDKQKSPLYQNFETCHFLSVALGFNFVQKTILVWPPFTLSSGWPPCSFT